MPEQTPHCWLNYYVYCYCCCSVFKSCLILCDPMNCSIPGSPVLHYLPEFAQIHVHWIGDAIQPSHPLPPIFPFVFNLSEHQEFFQWVSSLHQLAKVLELQFHHETGMIIVKCCFTFLTNHCKNECEYSLKYFILILEKNAVYKI